MKPARRQFLRLAAGAAALSATLRNARAQTHLAQLPSEQRIRSLIQRLALYADSLARSASATAGRPTSFKS